MAKKEKPLGQTKALDRYLSPIDVWAMAFGCMVGWGVFAMPGTTFLPVAGPAGTVIAMLAGMLIMLIIGNNFSFLMSRSSMTGGVYSYTKEAFGRDHAFLSCWFLCLSYLTIVFLNGTALFFIVQYYTLMLDAHPLSYLRANTAMQQFPQFHETHGITEGDGMWLAPEGRVPVW